MAAAMATSMAILNAKCFNPISKPSKQSPILSIKPLPKITSPNPNPNFSIAITPTAIAGAVFSTLSLTPPAFAAQQLAEIADGDSRGQLLLLVVTPAILWVLYNILQPALNQINKMRSSKGVIIGLGIGGLAAAGLMQPAAAEAAEAVSDNRGQLLLFVVTPALVWVAYNILQPALNQINRMRSD